MQYALHHRNSASKCGSVQRSLSSAEAASLPSSPLATEEQLTFASALENAMEVSLQHSQGLCIAAHFLEQAGGSVHRAYKSEK